MNFHQIIHGLKAKAMAACNKQNKTKLPENPSSGWVGLSVSMSLLFGWSTYLILNHK